MARRLFSPPGEDVDRDGKVLTVAGSIVRLKGVGLVRQDNTTKGGNARSVPLPQFAVDALHRRKAEQPRANTAGVLFFRPRRARCATRTTSENNGAKSGTPSGYRRVPRRDGDLTGLEPATSALTGRRANQLRHRALPSIVLRVVRHGYPCRNLAPGLLVSGEGNAGRVDQPGRAAR